MTQKFDRWLAVPDVVEPFGGISVVSHGNGATILFLHAKERDLKVTFKQIWTLTIHEELAHPSVDGNFDFPRLTNNPGAYPLLTVSDSEWLKSFSDTRLAGPSRMPTHYLFISMSYFVDVLSFIAPEAKWVDQVPVERDPIFPDAGAQQIVGRERRGRVS